MIWLQCAFPPIEFEKCGYTCFRDPDRPKSVFHSKLISETLYANSRTESDVFYADKKKNEKSCMGLKHSSGDVISISTFNKNINPST